MFALFPAASRSSTTDAERDLALSAAPKSIQSAAGIWIRTGNGYRQLRKGTNGWQCAVIQEAPQTLEPECYNPDAARTLMQVDIFKRRRIFDGAPAAVVEREIEARYENGTFKLPRSGDVIFMLSTRNKVLAAPGHVIDFPPHVMIAAPHATPGQLGGETSYAFLIDEGKPNALIIIPVTPEK